MQEESKDDSVEWRTLGVSSERYKVTETVVDMTRPQVPLREITVPAKPQDVIFDLNKTALIIIDMQNDFCSDQGWLKGVGQDISGVKDILSPLERTSQKLRSLDVPIIWVNWGIRPDRLNLSSGTQLTFNRDGCGPGLGDDFASEEEGKPFSYKILEKDSWGAEIVHGLSPESKDVFVDKHRISGFWDTPLDSILRNIGVRTLLFAGVNADQCVFATLMDANFHGYDTLMLEDCVATTSPGYCMEATLYNVRFAFGFTLISDDLLKKSDQI